MDKERMLILSNVTGGLYGFRKELIIELSKTYDIYTASLITLYKDDLERLGVKVINVHLDRRGLNPIKDFRLLVEYITIIKKCKPKIILTYTIKPNIYGGIAAKITKTEYAVNITGLGTSFQNKGLLKRIVEILYKISLSKAKVVYFENSFNRDQLVSLNCCDKDKTIVLNGAGVNLGKFSYQPYPNNKIFHFLFIGRVMKEKGIDELFAVMKRMIDQGKNCCLDVVGPFEENYKQILDEYQTEGWLNYFGYQEDVRPYINSCDCFVLPSYHEGMANTNLECASSGRPIITSNIPGCKEAVSDGSGLLCEPQNIDSLYESMNRMYSLPSDVRKNMGLLGRKHMEETFDKDKVVANTVKYLLL